MGLTQELPCLFSAQLARQNLTILSEGARSYHNPPYFAFTSHSLQQALYEPAVEYYTAHSKRVRRKRNRHSQAQSSYPGPAAVSGLNIPRPLRPEGWTVRYEYKMACFAEFRSEDEVALKFVSLFDCVLVETDLSTIQALSGCLRHVNHHVWVNRYSSTAYEEVGGS